MTFKLTASIEGTREQIAAELRQLAKNIDTDSSNIQSEDLPGTEFESNSMFADIYEM